MRGVAASGSTREEGFSGDNDPTWIGIGFIVADVGLLVLLLTIGLRLLVAALRQAGRRPYRRRRSPSLYLVLLGVAWLAMSGKWG